MAPRPPPPDEGLATTLALEQGMAALRTGHATTALARFDEALALDPEQPRAALHRAHALAQLGRHAEALAAARACALASPDDEAPAALVLRLEGVLRDEALRVDEERRARDAGWVEGGVVDGRWEVFGEAHGGMGRVFFVRDRAFGGLELAVKTLAPRAGASASEVERARAFFLRETQVWLDLGAHPHVVSGYYTLEVHGALRFFMEYVPGLALDEVLRRARGVLPVAHALDLAIQLCAAVEYVHARGALHRDLKSGNCLVMQDGTLRLTDFGLGTSSSAPRDESNSAQGLSADAFARAYAGAAGTPQYMAPEQWRSLAEAGPPADVYALGVLLYELCTGHYPFDATPASLARYEASWPPGLRKAVEARRASRELLLWLSHAHLSPLPMREFREESAPSVEALALRCLAKEPGDRPTAGELRAGLLRAYEEVAGRPYGRALPGAFEPTRAGENNRAVSYAVMGETARAREILDAWLAREPLAVRPWLNHRLLALRERERDRSPEGDPARVARAFFSEVRPATPDAEAHDAALRSVVRALARHAPWPREEVRAAAPAPDGRVWVAAGDALHCLRAPGGGDEARDVLAPERTVAHSAAVYSVAVSPDGSLVATGSYDRGVRVFSARDGSLRATLTGHRDLVTALQFSPDGRLLASAGGASSHREDRTVRLWNAASLEAAQGTERVLRGHRGAVTAVAFSADGSRLVTGTSEGVVHFWDLRDDQLLYLFTPDRVPRMAQDDPHPAVRALGFDRGGNTLWIARADGALTRHDTASGDLRARYGPTVPGLTAAVLDPRDAACEALVASYEDGAVRAWASASREPAAHPGAYRGAVSVLAFGADPARPARPVLYLAGARGLVARDPGGGVLDEGDESWPLLIEAPRSAQGLLRAAREREELEARLDAGDAAALPLLQRLLRDAPEIAGDRDALVARLHRAGHAGAVPVSVREAWSTHALALEGAVQWAGFCGQGQRARAVLTASAGSEGQRGGLVRVTWDIERNLTERVRLRSEQDGPVRSLGADPEGSLVLLGFDAGVAALVRGDTGRVQRRLDGGAAAVSAVALSPDGSLALLGDEAGQVRCVRCRDGALVARWRAHRRPVASLSFSPDGSLALSGGWDRVARVWSVRDPCAEPARELGPHRAGVTAVSFAPDGRRVLTAGDDGVRLWSLLDGKRYATLEGFTAGVTCAVFSPGGRFAAAGGWEPGVRLFRARDGAPERVLDGHSFGVSCAAFSASGDALLLGGADGSLRRWLIDAEWRVLEELLPEAERALAEAASIEPLLAVWRDVCRAADRPGISPVDLDRLGSLRGLVRARLRELVASATPDMALLREALTALDPSLASDTAFASS